MTSDARQPPLPPKGFRGSGRLLVSRPFRIIGPHQHEAEALSHVLAGKPSFVDSDGESRVTRPGDAVHHAPWQVHIQDFRATPTALLYCWTGAVEPEAALVAEG